MRRLIQNTTFDISSVPSHYIKNREDRLIVLNNIAQQIIEEARGQHPTHVFHFRNHPVTRINNTAWKGARLRAGLTHVRVHDLRHTFGRRLRSAGVTYEDRQDLLGHKSGRMTTHYSGAEIYNLIDAANRICERKNCGPILQQLKSRARSSRESHEPNLGGKLRSM